MNIFMFSRNLSVPDFVRRFFVSCTQISEAYAVRTVMKFGYDWRKIGHKSKRRKDFESTFIPYSRYDYTIASDKMQYFLSYIIFQLPSMQQMHPSEAGSRALTGTHLLSLILFG